MSDTTPVVLLIIALAVLFVALFTVAADKAAQQAQECAARSCPPGSVARQLSHYGCLCVAPAK